MPGDQLITSQMQSLFVNKPFGILALGSVHFEETMAAIANNN